MSGYVINPWSIVVHTTSCTYGPMNRRSDPTGYEALPGAVIDYLPNSLFCAHCCGLLLQLRRAGTLPTPPELGSQVPEMSAP